MSSATLKKIEAFAGALADQAKTSEIEFALKIEAARVLAPYYNALKKAQVQSDEGAEGEEITISGLQDQLAKVAEKGHGGTVSRHNRRRTPETAN